MGRLIYPPSLHASIYQAKIDKRQSTSYDERLVGGRVSLLRYQETATCEHANVLHVQRRDPLVFPPGFLC